MTRPLILAAAVLVAIASPTSVETAAATRVVTATIPASYLTHLDLHALDGTIDLKADPDPAATNVTISVALDPPRTKNFRTPVPAELNAVAIDWTLAANVLLVGLTNAREGNIEATWTVTVPARFSARIDAHDGALVVTGLTGGVNANLNAGPGGRRGSIDVNVPRGRLDLSLAVGNIRASRGTTEFSSADVRSTVGDAQMFLLGHEIVAPHRPGPGHRVVLDGKGPDTISLRVTVGDVSLRIG